MTDQPDRLETLKRKVEDCEAAHIDCLDKLKEAEEKEEKADRELRAAQRENWPEDRKAKKQKFDAAKRPGKIELGKQRIEDLKERGMLSGPDERGYYMWSTRSYGMSVKIASSTGNIVHDKSIGNIWDFPMITSQPKHGWTLRDEDV